MSLRKLGARVATPVMRLTTAPPYPHSSLHIQQRSALGALRGTPGPLRQGQSPPTAGVSHGRSAPRQHTKLPPYRGDGKPLRRHWEPVKDRYPTLAVDLRDPRRRLAVLIDGTNSNLLHSGGGETAAADEVSLVQRTSRLFTHVLPAVATVGVPVLLRVFAHHLPAAWEALLVGHAASSPTQQQQTAYSSSSFDNSRGGDHRDGTDTGRGGSHGMLTLPPTSAPAASAVDPASAATPSPSQVQVEFFRVERFIPIPMQMEADAMHIYDFRHANQIEGVCYVCHEVDRAVYEALMEQQGGDVNAMPRSTGGSPSRSPATTTFFNQYLLDELGMVKESNTDQRAGDGAS